MPPPTSPVLQKFDKEADNLISEEVLEKNSSAENAKWHPNSDPVSVPALALSRSTNQVSPMDTPPKENRHGQIQKLAINKATSIPPISSLSSEYVPEKAEDIATGGEGVDSLHDNGTKTATT